MASNLFFTIKNRVSNLIANATARGGNPKTPTCDLFSRISPLGNPDTSLTPVIDQWVREGGKIKDSELKRIIRTLRSRKRYTQALEVSGWMSHQRAGAFSLADHAIRLDLIGRVHGLESAEDYFEKLDDQDKTDKCYGALLNCYVREGLVVKSLSHMQKMIELGFTLAALNYNDLMRLYTNTGQFDKVPDVLSEMQSNGVSPDIYSYRICMNSYGSRSDLDGVKKILEEMENQPQIALDWLSYAMAASIYIKAGKKKEALTYLEKCEKKVNKDPIGYNHLISLYACLGNKAKVMKFWTLAKANCKKQTNRDYVTLLCSLVKLGEFEMAEKLLEEWESFCQFYDFQVPNVLLIGYSKNGLVEKAEAILRDIIRRQKVAKPNSWAIVAAGYVDKQNMEKAFECMKEALAVQPENGRWKPKPSLTLSILNWLGENRDIDEVEEFVRLLETKIVGNRDVYHTLLKAYIRSGKNVGGLLKRMKDHGIEEDEKTKTMLSS